jgi:roadblock/LC7 domain-containing protein
MKFPKKSAPGFIDTVTKNKAFLPSPSHYKTTYDWSTLMAGTKGKFLKQKRITTTEEILNNKNNATPSPS